MDIITDYFQQYSDIARTVMYNQEKYRTIYLIFEGAGGNQIITKEMLPEDVALEKVLILSEEMKQGLHAVHNEIREILNVKEKYSAAQFYFTHYGGSKTQYLHLVQMQIQKKEAHTLCILFEDLSNITPEKIFEGILHQIFMQLPKHRKFRGNHDKYSAFLEKIMHLIEEIHLAFNQNRNIQKAQEILNEMYKIKNPHYHKLIEELAEILQSTILIDQIEILNKIMKLMKACSDEDFVFLFLLDEVDLWIEADSGQLQFSQDFLKKNKFMKLFLEIPDSEIKAFYLFACTDRVNYLFQNQQHEFSARNPTASRMARIFTNAETILEPGVYGNQIDQAIVHLAAYHKAYHNVEINGEFFEKTIPLMQEEYARITRRHCNSQIIKLLNNFKTLKIYLTKGLKNWTKQVQNLGTTIQKYLPSICKRMNIEFVRKDLLVDPHNKRSDKLDGYFVNTTINKENIHTLVEIKVTKRFRGDKGYQALQYLLLHEDEPVIMIIFSPTEMKEILKELNDFALSQGYKLEIMKRLYFIHIQDPYAFSAITSLENIIQDAEEAREFFDAYANWLEFFGLFSDQYRQIRDQLGIDDIIPSVPPEGEEDEEEGEDSEEGKEPEFTADQKTILRLLNHGFREKIFNKSGRVHKSTMEALVSDNNLGISDLSKYYDIMKRYDILTSVTDKTVVFQKNFYNIASREELNTKLVNYLTKNTPTHIQLI